MEPAVGVGLLWLLFAGTHIGLATRRIRAALVARLGEVGFTLVFSLVAAVGFTALVRYHAAHRLEGAAGAALGTVPALRGPLVAAAVVGMALMVAGVLVFQRSPMALFARGHHEPRGLERVTRHPFFTGLILFAVAHALLATRLVGTVEFGGLALVAAVGARHQDRKLLALRGRDYADYLAVTSALPFVAILTGRQRLATRELPQGALAAGLLAAVALRTQHDAIFSHGGAWVIGVVVGGAAVLMVQGLRQAHRRRVRAPLAQGST